MSSTLYDISRRLEGLGSSGDKLQGAIKIYCFSTDDQIVFTNAHNMNFSETYTLSWAPTEVYGRMDPVATYKNTKRRVNISFELISDGVNTVETNANIDRLRKALYPVYNDGAKGTAIISSPPMFRVKWSSIVSHDYYDANNEGGRTLKGGLLGYLDSFEIKPAMLGEQAGGWSASNGYLQAKNFNVNINLNVIHEHPLGTRIKINTVAPRQPPIGSFMNPELQSVEGFLSAPSFVPPGAAPTVSPSAPANILEEIEAARVAQIETARIASLTPQDKYTAADINPVETAFYLTSERSRQADIAQIVNSFDYGRIKYLMSLKNSPDPEQREIYKSFEKQLFSEMKNKEEYKGIKF